jgi:outer membrane protein assembly factor BamB
MTFISAGAALALCLGGSLAAQPNQHGWRGPERNGIYPETGLLKQWPASGPQMLWETEDVGKGHSSPVVVGGRLYITGLNENEDQEMFSAYNLQGKKLYTTAYGKPWNGPYPEARTTPAIVGDKAYVISGDGKVVCLNTADGKILWSVDGASVFGRKTGTWGISECPLVFDGKVIFCPGGEQTAMVALNAQTGKVIWKSPSLHETSNYASPLLITHNGKQQIVTLAGKSAFGVDPATGKIQWTFSNWGLKARGEKISPNMALYKDGRIFFAEGYGMNSFQLELNADNTGVKETWVNNDISTHVGGYVLLNGVVYGSNWISNGMGNWVAVDWNTGKTIYDTAWSGGKSKGSIISADGMLYCYEERHGTVGLVKPGKTFDVVSQFRITKGTGPYWAHPVIDKGVLYIRHGGYMAAFKIK